MSQPEGFNSHWLMGEPEPAPASTDVLDRLSAAIHKWADITPQGIVALLPELDAEIAKREKQ